MISIVHKTRQSPQRSATWWFTAYYAFNASLVVFSCILLKVESSQMAPGPSGNQLATMSCPRSYKMLEMLRHL
ncbi:hypothetical protein J3E68DRAFT_398781 [Trichoderma sp. SZMC 28012]